MSAPAKPKAPGNLDLWSALGKTDPKHTKSFTRAGGFKGTAIKPIWIVRQLTELLGPVGKGWGMGEPKFETVAHGEGEVLVYCTVRCWHGSPENAFFGVGGDKAVAKNKYGLFADDEAFKKAFTDAVGNAFKFLGVGADIHMGQFEDSKYLETVRREFANDEASANPPKGAVRDKAGESAVSPDGPAPRAKLAGPYTSKTALQTAVKAFVHELNGCGDYDELHAFLHTKDSLALIEQVKRDAVDWWEGSPDMPAEFVPLSVMIERAEESLGRAEGQRVNDMVQAG